MHGVDLSVLRLIYCNLCFGIIRMNLLQRITINLHRKKCDKYCTNNQTIKSQKNVAVMQHIPRAKSQRQLLHVPHNSSNSCSFTTLSFLMFTYTGIVGDLSCGPTICIISENNLEQIQMKPNVCRQCNFLFLLYSCHVSFFFLITESSRILFQ